MKGIIQEIIYVFKSLEKSTIRWLIVMVVSTLALSVVMVTTIENPVFERWSGEREASQLLKERQEQRDEQDKTTDSGEDTEDSKDKEPVF